MKKNTFLMLFYIVLFCNKTASCKQYATIKDSCLLVKNRYKLLLANDTKQNEIKFYESYPSNFPSFVNIFGYRGRYGKKSVITSGCLLSESYEYVNKFFSLRFINKYIFYNKVLSLSKNAYWQSDGVEFFQNKCIDMTLNDKQFLIFLNSKSVQEIKSFTEFILDSLVVDKELKKKIKTRYFSYSRLRKVL